MAPKKNAPDYIRYTPAQEGAGTRVIRMVEVQRDPLEPPRFKLNQKAPAAPPSPPAPVMHSPPRKSTAEELANWKIPPCVSSWKNPRGYTVPLDKRCALDGRNAIQPEIINPKFAQLSEALYIATRQHREALEEKAKAEKLIAMKEKEQHDEKLRRLAQQARQDRIAVHRGLDHDRDKETDEDDVDEVEVRERTQIREERHRERVRNANIKASAPSRRTKLDRERERDISEQIALGMAKPTNVDNDVHDQRLYNQSQGLDDGFGAEDEYTVYDKAWKSQASHSNNYRPTQSVADEIRESEPSSSVPFKPSSDQLAPIQFEKDDGGDLEDVFNVESFLRDAKQKAKSMQNESRSSKKRRT